MSAERDAGPKAKFVLVVDDEQVIADSLAAILRQAGYVAAVAYDGQTALAKCKSFRPDLVISDVVMPGMSGVEMAVLIKEILPSCKILLFSGQATTRDLLEQARQSGHDFDLLSKPIHPTELLAKLAS
jgi:CheY-like chemotaxis protein